MKKPQPLYKAGDRLVYMHPDPDFTLPLDDKMIVEGEPRWNPYGKGYYEYNIIGKANPSPEGLLLPYVEGQKHYILNK